MFEVAKVVDEVVEEDVVVVVDESVEEDVDEVAEEDGIEVEDVEGVDEEVVELVKVDDEDDVEVVEEGDLGVTARYATAPATTIISITMTAVTVRDMARDPLPLKILTYKVLTGLGAPLFEYC